MKKRENYNLRNKMPPIFEKENLHNSIKSSIFAPRFENFVNKI